MKRLIILCILVLCGLMLNACATGQMYRSAASKSNALSPAQVTLALAEAGDPHYQYSAGLFSEAGTNGFKQNIEQAVYWYDLAAKQGYLPAYSRLGVLYEFGRGLPKNKKTAVDYYEAAACPNLSDYAKSEYFPFIKMEMIFAQQQLGRLYSSGDGIKADHAKGYMWNKIVISQPPETGKEELDQAIRESQELAKLFHAMLETKITTEEWKNGETFFQNYLKDHALWLAVYNNGKDRLGANSR